MKPSELKKDSKATVRINGQVKEKLREIGMTEQKIIDAYIDQVVEVDIVMHIMGQKCVNKRGKK